MHLVKTSLTALVVTCIVFFGLSTLKPEPTTPLQGVTQGQEYTSTTTPLAAGVTTVCTSPNTVKAAYLGSVIVTKTGTTDTFLYNATTSNVNLRTGNTATSSLEQIVIPASIAAGTYMYDLVWDKGILVVYGANSASSTITCRY